MSNELDRLADEVLEASRALVAIAVRSLDERASDLTLVQYRCLVVLVQAGPVPTTALSVVVGVHQSTVTRATDHLVGKGLAAKQRDHEDRRRTVIEASAAGRDVITAVMAGRRRAVREVLSAMSLQDVRWTAHALSAFTAAAEAIGTAPEHGHPI